MKIDTVIEHGNNETYYLVQETEQNNQKYFLAIKLDENDMLTTESKIFVEEIEDGEIYLEPLEQGKVYDTISAVFINGVMKEIEKLPEDS